LDTSSLVELIDWRLKTNFVVTMGKRDMKQQRGILNWYWLLTLALCLNPLFAYGDEKEIEELEESEETEEKWDIESPPGPTQVQQIDADEGTWMNLDVSPSGSEIVFDFLGDIYVMPIAGADGDGGGVPEKITEGRAWDMHPSFSPDGKWIAFSSDRTGKNKKAGDNIWIIEREGGRLRQITNESYRLLSGPSWSPDGEYIVARKHFTGRRSLGAGEMWLYHWSGVPGGASAGVPMTSRSNDQKDVNEPVFSPDGKYLYFSQDMSPGNAFEYNKDPHGQIYAVRRLEIETGELENFITGPGGACRPIPSPDGRQIAFVRRVGAKTGLHVFDADSGEVRVVTDELERDMQEVWAIHGVYPNYAWTSDGESVVIWAKGKIRKVNIADGVTSVIPFRVKDTRDITTALRTPQEVAPESFDVKMLRWVQVSPKGDQVVYQALGHLYVRDLPEGTPTRLTSQTDHFEFYPSYSRSGEHIVYSTWDDESLGSVRVVSSRPGGNQENWIVTQSPGHFVDPVFTPDGKQIVFRAVGGGRIRSPLWSRNPGLYRAPVAGGKATRILKSAQGVHFGSSSDRLFFQRNQGGKDADNLKLMSCDLDGEEEREHFKSSWGTSYKVSPDGKWVALIERFNVYLFPFTQSGKVIDVGAGKSAIPTNKITDEAGDWIQFSGDSKEVYWALGPDLYSQNVESVSSVFPKAEASEEDEAPDPERIAIGFAAAHDVPGTEIALVGGRIVTMGEMGIIEDGVILVSGNRIEKVGRRADLKVPANAKVYDVTGQTILPGFIDTHAHGAQSSNGITPQQNWVDLGRLAFGVTTIHDPSNGSQSIFAANEMTKAGQIVAPRTFSTGTILYGATGSSKAEIGNLEDARFHLRRMKAIGAFSVKSYNQPRRDQRQQILAAARELDMLVVPEGGATLAHNLTMIADGHTGIEHSLSVQTAYDDVFDLWEGSGVGYTPTLTVAYGGIWGENYWYDIDDLWLHPRLGTFIPPTTLNPRSRRRIKAPLEDYNHIKVAEITKGLIDRGGLVQTGGHGQLTGICTHWEMWSMVQGGMSPFEALRSGTLHGATYLGMDAELGTIEKGKIADLVVIDKDADPLENIRHSERIQYVVANGRLFEAATMTALTPAGGKRAPFFWESGRGAISSLIPQAAFCAGCVGVRQAIQ
jgi:Tol biopolymer transport system component/imidazolonepropionase-like amidohydrolase